MPSKSQILEILKEVQVFLQIDNQTNNDGYLQITNKTVKLVKTLSQNFFGQTLLLYSDYPSVLPKTGKPVFTLDNLINNLLTSDLSNVNILNILDNLLTSIILLMHDMNVFEQLSSNNSINIKEMGEFFFTHSGMKKITISEFRLGALNFFITNNKDLLFVALLKPLKEKLENNQNPNEQVKRIINNLNLLIEVFKVNEINYLNSDNYLKTVKLPHSRKINEKCELIHKYYEFHNSQNYGSNLPLQAITTSGQTSVSYVTYINKYNDYHKQYINEFEKLLNWKKYRIYLTKLDYVNPRATTLELDDYIVKNQTESNTTGLSLYNNPTVKKTNSYLNTDPFEQFCNQLFNEELILSRYANISYSVSSSVLKKTEYNIQPSFKYELEFNKKNIYNKVIIKGGQKITRKSNLYFNRRKED
jgi:hypothetical protein